MPALNATIRRRMRNAARQTRAARQDLPRTNCRRYAALARISAALGVARAVQRSLANTVSRSARNEHLEPGHHAGLPTPLRRSCDWHIIKLGAEGIQRAVAIAARRPIQPPRHRDADGVSSPAEPWRSEQGTSPAGPLRL